ncbi:TetR/AcrR family transcriptional regulator [Halobacillus trueperi]|uniref:DNA-binding transcriptional regulator, AcrR family n=2 Tax=Halobacillus TaxID=45667 RepID=A0A1H0REF5_HALAD|nr:MULTISPECIES: TetR/AcrR family transcriptional regulator [Halobacillus]RDY71434.1 TetR/AcrR family transcriptional regulator [Halobacillus trueperi]SDP27801.1 DNA-binding transcriptional regulator, AcrR family [Halobacillus aidingensis]
MKEKMMDTIIELFGKKGFQGTSIQDIVEANGVTKGTFYYYFKNKEDVLIHIHQTFIDHLLEGQEKIITNVDLSHSDQLYQIVELLIHNIRTNGHSALVFFQEMRHLSEEKTAIILPKRQQFQENIQKVLEEGMKAGEFKKDLRADMLSYAVLGMANWSYFWYEPDGEVDEKSLTDLYMRLIFKGIEEETNDH